MQGDPYQVSLLVLCLKNFASSGAHKWLELYIGKELLKEPDIYPALFLFLFFFCFWHLIIKEIWRRETGLIYLDGRVNREGYNKKKSCIYFYCWWVSPESSKISESSQIWVGFKGPHSRDLPSRRDIFSVIPEEHNQ